MPPSVDIIEYLSKGGIITLLLVLTWMLATRKLVWGPHADAREQLERDNALKWETRFMSALEYTREAQNVTQAAHRVAEKAVEQKP